MSRTYRRKNDTWDFTDYDFDWVDGYLKKVPMNPKSKDYKKSKAHFHSDSYRGWGVPHWFVNMFFERANRRKTKKIIGQWLKNPENLDVLLDKKIKNAGWYYW